MESATKRIESNVRTLEGLFKENKFNIPFYQRDYAWKKDEIDDLWNDLMDVVKGYQDTHFFGQIVTYSGREKDDLIDGQQRLTTSSILLAAINNLSGEILAINSCNSQDHDESFRLRELQNNVSSTLIKKVDVINVPLLNEQEKLNVSLMRLQIDQAIQWKDEPSLKLQPVSKNDDSIHEFFIGLFNGATSTNDHNKKIDPVKNIKSAYDAFYERLVEYVFADRENVADRLQNIFDSFTKKFFVSLISTKNEEDAFVIFETLNSRGKDLEPAEIIKTHLMSQIAQESDDFISEFDDRWKAIANEFKKNSEKLTKFIRVYWAASHRLVSSKQLYRSISSDVRGLDKTVTFLSDLEKVVGYYVAVEENGLKAKKDREYIGNDDLLGMLSLLKRFRVTLHHPILFSMILNDMDQEDMIKILYDILSVYMRHRVICMYGTNTLETGYANVAEDIWNHKIQTSEEINDELDALLKKHDIEVKGSFQNLKKELANGAKEWTLKYLLFKFYQHEDNKDFEDMSIEQANLNKYLVCRIGSDDMIDDNYSDYIGNYILLEDTISILRDGPAVAAMKSSLITNQKLGENISDNGWDEMSIQDRQGKFAEASVDIW